MTVLDSRPKPLTAQHGLVGWAVLPRQHGLVGWAVLPRQHLVGFDCSKPALNDWLVRHAMQAQSSGSARTFIYTHQS